MSEYIDREKVLKILENSLNFSKTELNTAHKQFQKGCVSAIEDDIGNISHMPTEDVVPRSEVDNLIVEFKALVKGYLLDRGLYLTQVKNALNYAETELKKKYIGG
jgi:hypothetical protein